MDIQDNMKSTDFLLAAGFLASLATAAPTKTIQERANKCGQWDTVQMGTYTVIDCVGGRSETGWKRSTYSDSQRWEETNLASPSERPPKFSLFLQPLCKGAEQSEAPLLFHRSLLVLEPPTKMNMIMLLHTLEECNTPKRNALQNLST